MYRSERRASGTCCAERAIDRAPGPTCSLRHLAAATRRHPIHEDLDTRTSRLQHPLRKQFHPTILFHSQYPSPSLRHFPFCLSNQSSPTINCRILTPRRNFRTCCVKLLSGLVEFIVFINLSPGSRHFKWFSFYVINAKGECSLIEDTFGSTENWSAILFRKI